MIYLFIINNIFNINKNLLKFPGGGTVTAVINMDKNHIWLK